MTRSVNLIEVDAKAMTLCGPCEARYRELREKDGHHEQGTHAHPRRDDEEIVRESLSGWLAKDGYTLATATTDRRRWKCFAGPLVDPPRRSEDAGHGRPPGARVVETDPA